MLVEPAGECPWLCFCTDGVGVSVLGLKQARQLRGRQRPPALAQMVQWRLEWLGAPRRQHLFRTCRGLLGFEPDRRVRHRWRSRHVARWGHGSSWKGWESLGDFCTDGVGVSSWASGRLDCFVVGNDRHLYHKWFSGSWSGWEDSRQRLFQPCRVSWGPNRIDVFAIGGDHAMWHRWWDGSSWKGWESLGGFCTDGVGVSSWASGRLDCFVVGNDRQLWHKWFSGSWSGWEALGGNLYSNPAAVSWGSNRIRCIRYRRRPPHVAQVVQLTKSLNGDTLRRPRVHCQRRHIASAYPRLARQPTASPPRWERL